MGAEIRCLIKNKIGSWEHLSFLTHLLEILELLVAGEPLLLVHAAVDGDGREVLLDQQLRQGHATLHALHEDHHLRRE